MKQKKKKTKKLNNEKFNFDDEFIIGFSDSAKVVKSANAGSNKKKNDQKKKSSNKKGKKSVSTRKSDDEVLDGSKSKVIKVFLILLLFVGAGCFLCLSPNFNVQEIVVEKNKVVSSETIASLSEIKLYKNIFLINKLSAINKIEKNPYIESAKISRSLPNKVKIVVKEREEKFLLEFAEGKYAVIDGQGYILRTTNEAINLPILVGTKTDMNIFLDISDNKVRLCDEDLKKFDIITNIVETAKNYEVYTYITKIDVGDINNIKLDLQTEQKIVYLGSCSDLNTRILFMREIIEKEKGIKGEIFINGNLAEDKDKVFFRESVN